MHNITIPGLDGTPSQPAEMPRGVLAQSFVAYVVSLPPVMLLWYLTCPFDSPEILLPLAVVEWTAIALAFHFLCPWLGRAGALLGAITFSATLFVSCIVVFESYQEYGTFHQYSDDYWYLLQASEMVDILHSEGWNVLHAWSRFLETTSCDVSLAAWPCFLGLVSALLSDGNDLALIHAVALSLNATFLSLLLPLMLHVLPKSSRHVPWVALLCFFLLSGDPIVYAGISRKESLLQLALMLCFVSSLKLTETRVMLVWIAMLALGTFAVLSTRPVYVVFPFVLVYLNIARKIGLSLKTTAIGAIVLSIAVYTPLMLFQIRGFTIGSVLFSERSLDAAAGLGTTIYSIPLVGPYFYYLIAPIPMNPLTLSECPMLWANLIRSCGSLAYVGSVGCVVLWLLRKRLSELDYPFVLAALAFLMLFIAAVIASDDPRYKQPTNYYLAMMLFYARLDRRLAAERLRQCLRWPAASRQDARETNGPSVSIAEVISSPRHAGQDHGCAHGSDPRKGPATSRFLQA